MLIDKILQKIYRFSNADAQKIPEVNSCSPEGLDHPVPAPVALLFNEKNNM
jgi:hypothetical protein